MIFVLLGMQMLEIRRQMRQVLGPHRTNHPSGEREGKRSLQQVYVVQCKGGTEDASWGCWGLSPLGRYLTQPGRQMAWTSEAGGGGEGGVVRRRQPGGRWSLVCSKLEVPGEWFHLLGSEESGEDKASPTLAFSTGEQD